MWSTTLASFVLFLVTAVTLEAYPNDYNGQFMAKQSQNFDLNREKRALDRIGGGHLLGRSLDSENLDINERALDRIGGGHLLGRSAEDINASDLEILDKRALDRIGGGHLLGRSVEDINNNANKEFNENELDSVRGGGSEDITEDDLNKRALDRIGGGYLIGRSLDRIGGGHLIGRSLDRIGGGHLIGRSLDRIGGGYLMGRSLDRIGGGYLMGRSLDRIGGGYLMGRALDRIGGGHLLGRSVQNVQKRALDRIGGGHLLGRSLDRIGGGHLLGRGVDDNEEMYANENAPSDQYIRPERGFDSLKLGNTFGIAKRIQFKKQQNRRASHNSIMGYGFGRTARRDYAMNDFPLNQIREMGQLEAAPERRNLNNLDPFRFGAFGAAKRHAEQDVRETLKAQENPNIDSITREVDSHKQDVYGPDNYLKVFQNYPSNIEN